MKNRHRDEIAARLGDVVDPILFHRLSDLGTLRSVELTREGAEVVIAVPVDPYPAVEAFEKAVLAALATETGGTLRIGFALMGEEERSRLGDRLRVLDQMTDADGGAPHDHGHGQSGERLSRFAARAGKTRILAIASGKGGVGKSSVSVNLAVALAGLGHRVALLDADITGFSVPGMLGVAYAPIVLGGSVIPPAAYGIRCMSMGFFVEEERAIAWRGPMLHKALEQFLVDVHWGDQDFLVVDMPPGTGDVALSMAQQMPGAELYVVTTPQPAAERVAQRAGTFARHVKLALRGVIENMSAFVAPDGTRYEIFGSGGGERLACDLGVPLLAQIPLVDTVRSGGDEGRPVGIVAPESEVALMFTDLADRIVGLGPARVYRSELVVS